LIKSAWSEANVLNYPIQRSQKMIQDHYQKNSFEDAAVFQILGEDAAESPFLRRNQKEFILRLICVDYRLVHLTLLTSLSTDAF
ncbi:hypothetical protein AVEN_257149-1, partial [Araneus ventricosus]